VLSQADVAARAERSKTSLLVGIEDRVGALFDMLQPFKETGVNLTKIESHPSRERAWTYWFFLDCEGHVGEANVKAALEAVRRHARQVKVLGSYPTVSEPWPVEGKPSP